MTEPAPPGELAADALHQPPPFWRRWSQLYWLVGGLLAAEVLVSWLLTQWAT